MLFYRVHCLSQSLLFSGCFPKYVLLSLVLLDAECTDADAASISLRLSLSISFLPVCGLSVSAAAAVVFILSATPPPALTEACDTQALLGSFSGGWAGGATTGGHVSGSCQHLDSVSGVDASKQTVKLQVLIQFSFHLRPLL